MPPKNKKISALILAAGASSRMGRVKALLPLPLGPGGKNCSALEGLARLYQSQGIEDIFVVSGFHAAEVEAEAARLGLKSARNENPEQGMFSSVCAGLEALWQRGAAHEKPAAVFIHPVDIALNRPLSLISLLEAADKAEDDMYSFIPLFAGQEGHPPLIPARFVQRILAHNGKEGLRGVLFALPRRVIPVADAMILEDMDRPEDYARLLRLAARRDTMGPEEAWMLLRQYNEAPKVLRHARAVAAVAAAFARRLLENRNEAGLPENLNPQDALAGGFLHDIRKGAPHHERAGGELLERLGLPKLAAITRAHLDVDLPDSAPISTCELVFLADKYCAGADFVPLSFRYRQQMNLLAENSEACTAVAGRLQRARKLEQRLAEEMGCEPGVLAQAALKKGLYAGVSGEAPK